MLYHNWQKDAGPGAPYDKASPNLKALLAYALANFGGYNLGIYFVRPITGGTAWSSHAYGAANDWGYLRDPKAPKKGEDRLAALRYIEFLIEHHEVLGVQMIVDEAYDRTWRCSRPEPPFNGGPGWKPGKVTGGGSWLHIETTQADWFNDTPIDERLAPPDPDPDPTPQEDPDMLALDYKEHTPDYTAFCWTGTHLSWVADGFADAVLRRSGTVRQAVDRTELLGIIRSSTKTSTAPPVVVADADLKAAWG